MVVSGLKFEDEVQMQIDMSEPTSRNGMGGLSTEK